MPCLGTILSENRGAAFRDRAAGLRIAPSSCPGISSGTDRSTAEAPAPTAGRETQRGSEHDPEKWTCGFPKRSCSRKTKAVILFGITALDTRRAWFLGAKAGGVKLGGRRGQRTTRKSCYIRFTPKAASSSVSRGDTLPSRRTARGFGRVSIRPRHRDTFTGLWLM
jgi:hypothetical protein